MKKIILLSNDSILKESFNNYFKDNSFFEINYYNNLDKVKLNNYDLIISDYFIDEYDGYDYLKKVNNTIKVIVLLPYHMNDVINLLSYFNISYILIKPILFTNLVDKINIICNNQINYKKDLDEAIIKFFNLIGLSFKYRGSYLLYDIIYLVINNNTPININLYDILSKRCGDSTKSIERNIRYAIQVSCTRMSPSIIDQYFGNIYNQYTGLIGNMEFINVLVKNIIFFTNKKD